MNLFNTVISYEIVSALGHAVVPDKLSLDKLVRLIGVYSDSAAFVLHAGPESALAAYSFAGIEELFPEFFAVCLGVAVQSDPGCLSQHQVKI